MKKAHKKMPPILHLEDLFDYDPNTGGLYKKGSEHCDTNCAGTFTPSGHRTVFVKGYGSFLVHRIVFFMFHRRDPGKFLIDHINGDPADNRIKNLRRCRPKANAINLRSKGKYVVDDKGVSRWVSGVVKS